MEERYCFLIGHRDAPEAAYPALMQALEAEIKAHGPRRFLVGRSGKFDAMAARAVAQLKPRYPGTRLILLLPYHPGTLLKPPDPIFDEALFPPGMERVPPRLAIARANRFALAHADCLIVYVLYPSAGARPIYEAALRLQAQGKIRVVNIAKMLREAE